MNTITDRDVKRAAVIYAYLEMLRDSGQEAGKVNVIKLQCSPRCAFEYPDNQLIRQLLDDYELRKVLPIPQKSINQAFGILINETKSLQSGRIGGSI